MNFRNKLLVVFTEFNNFAILFLSIFDREVFEVNTSFNSLDEERRTFQSERDQIKTRMKNYNKMDKKKNRKIIELCEHNKQLISEIHYTSEENAQLKEEKEALNKTIQEQGVICDPLIQQIQNYEIGEIGNSSDETDLQHAFASQNGPTHFNHHQNGLDTAKQVCIEKIRKFEEQNENISLRMNNIVDEVKSLIENGKQHCNEIKNLIKICTSND
jgi:uncharacterized coiled-coil DUF342 family protein